MPEKQIKCFLDESPTSDASANISTTSFDINDAASNPLFIGTVPAASSSEQDAEVSDVIVVHEDGQIRRLSADLKSQRWAIKSTSDDVLAGHEVSSCFTVPFEEARKILLRKRQDIVASVLGDAFGNNPDESTILVLVSCPKKSSTLRPSDSKLHFFHVPSHIPEDGFVVRESERLRHLMTLNLPNFEGETSLKRNDLRWDSNLSSGDFSVSFPSGFISYDISQFSPQVSSHLIISDGNLSSIMRISSQSIIGAGQSAVYVYDAKYQSLQAELTVKEISQVAGGKARSDKAQVSFVSYFSKLGVAVASYRNYLLSFDLDSLQSQRVVSRKRPRTSLLIDSIGKGINPDNNGINGKLIEQCSLKYMRPLGLTSKEDAEAWNELKTRLDGLVAAKQPAKFDSTIKAKLSKVIGSESERFPFQTDFVDAEIILYLLSKIFSIKDNNELRISFLPPATFEWLFESSHLSVTSIQTALRRSSAPYTLVTVPEGALVQALANHDASVKLLVVALRSPVHPSPDELTHAIKILLDVARSHATNSADPQKSLTDSTHTEGNEQTEAGEKSSVQKLSHSSEKTLINAMAGLNLALTKLHSHPVTRVSQSVHTTLSNTDILAIIHHLRHALATGGHTARFTEEPPVAFSSPEIPTLPLSIIVDLLTACIDAVGPSGWISAAGFASSAGSEASLIADMKSEISAALAGIEEATFLKGMFREFIRCCETTAPSSSSSSSGRAKSRKTSKEIQATSTHDPRIKRTERHNGAKIIVYDSNSNNNNNTSSINPDDESVGNSKMLPLSLKMDDEVPGVGIVGDDHTKTKIRKRTGEIKTRSSREMGYLKRKAVGKYSFERIVI